MKPRDAENLERCEVTGVCARQARRGRRWKLLVGPIFPFETAAAWKGVKLTLSVRRRGSACPALLQPDFTSSPSAPIPAPQFQAMPHITEKSSRKSPALSSCTITAYEYVTKMLQNKTIRQLDNRQFMWYSYMEHL